MKDLTRFLSKTALSRVPSPIRAITNYLLTLPPDKDLISVAGGMPAPATFPFSEFSIKLTDGSSFAIEGDALNEALQYGRTAGMDKLINLWNGMINKIIEPAPGTERRCIVTNGAEHGSYMVMSALLDPGDSVLMSSPVYPATLLKAQNMGANVVEIIEDSNIGGMCPKYLRSKLESWPKDVKKPKLLVTCPTGGNPSGANISDSAREEIYRLSCEHDFLLLEDDPYYFINYGSKLRSFMSYDVEGRVIRLDSMSKVLCPGLRIGFCTAPKQIADVVELHAQVSVIHTCNISQIVVLHYLMHVGHDGFLRHAEKIAGYYRTQRDLIVAALEKHMSDLATWIAPGAGMFIWLEIHGIKDTHKLAELAMDNGVSFVPGGAFVISGISPNIRLAFSQVPAAKIDEAVIRIANSVRQFKEAE